MLEKEKYYRLNLFKKIFFFLIVFTLSSQKSFSSPKEKIINNFIKINNISFEFQQRIDDKIEVGKCYIKYPKLIYCLYDNKDKKEAKVSPDDHLNLVSFQTRYSRGKKSGKKCCI